MKIIELELNKLKPYEKNPRKNDAAVDYVANSIKEFGFKVPIVIDKDNVIVAGHTRYKAAKKLNLINVPCIVADDLTPEQVKAYRLADNKVAEKAEWDFDILDEELSELLEFDFDMTDFGFEFEEQEEPKEIIEDDVPDVPVEPKAKYKAIETTKSQYLINDRLKHIKSLKRDLKEYCHYKGFNYDNLCSAYNI